MSPSPSAPPRAKPVLAALIAVAAVANLNLAVANVAHNRALERPERTRAIALWSALGGGISALGPLASGALLTRFAWESVFFESIVAGARGAFLHGDVWAYVAGIVAILLGGIGETRRASSHAGLRE